MGRFGRDAAGRRVFGQSRSESTQPPPSISLSPRGISITLEPNNTLVCVLAHWCKHARMRHAASTLTSTCQARNMARRPLTVEHIGDPIG